MNWQTTTANLFARLTIKQMMRRDVSIATMRRAIDALERLFPRRPVDCEVAHDHALADCEAEWVRPRDLSPDRVLLHFPGGAYVVRFPNFERGLVARLCRAAQARGRLVFYRLAPEHPFPAGHEDGLAAYRQLLDLGFAPQRIVLSGLSAGGGLALGVLLAIRDRGWPLPAAAIAMSPLTDLTDTHVDSSRVRNARRDAVLSLAHGEELRSMYVGGDPALYTHPYVSPAFGDYHDLPPVLFQVGSTEVMLDDSRRAASRIRATGGSAEVEIWDGMPHGWQGLPFIPDAGRAIERIADFVRIHVP
ncbi:MAG: alpha/beta hydrolase fold domain-containing protein [Proteobacteria bacterium]|nr:alpha/beta hydrolase fold domain-containing protein [Pseudomonadota bacterium]